MPGPFLNGLLSALDAVDRIMGPGASLDITPSSISIITRTWPGAAVGSRNGDGSPVDTVLALPPYICIRHVSEREIAGSGGRYKREYLKAGPIRPSFTNPLTGIAGGFTQAQLDPTAGNTAKNVQVIYRLTQEYANASGDAGDYTLVEFHTDDADQYMLVLARKRTTP